MRAEQNREPPFGRHTPDHLQELEGPHGIDGARRLVENQNRRLVQQGAGELEARAHSGGEREADAVADVAEPHCVEHVGDPRPELLAA